MQDRVLGKSNRGRLSASGDIRRWNVRLSLKFEIISWYCGQRQPTGKA